MDHLTSVQLHFESAIKQLLENEATVSFTQLVLDEKLKLLSYLLSCMNNPESAQTENLQTYLSCKERRDQWLNFLKSCMLSERDKHVLFVVRKLLTRTLSLAALQGDFLLITDIVSSGPELTLHLHGLQICRELFASNNPHNETLVSEFGPLVLKSWDVLQHCEDNSLYPQCLFAYFAIITKLYKHACKVKENSSLLSLLTRVLKFKDTYFKILFGEKIAHYVKEKLLKFLCLVLKSYSSPKVNGLKTEIFHLSSVLFEHVTSVNISVEMRQPGCSTFTGKGSVMADSLGPDARLLRQWTFLHLCMSAVLINDKGCWDKLVAFLVRIDETIKEVLNMKSTVWFPWLPDIFGDQDDMWIDAMSILMDIFLLEDSYIDSLCPAARNQHHAHFLQFVRIVGYDHLVLIDLLTSPETNFLTYLVKYLRQLLDTWRQFIVVADNKFDEENNIYSSCLQDSGTSDILNKADAVNQSRNFLCDELNTETSVFAEISSDNASHYVHFENFYDKVSDKNDVIACSRNGLQDYNKNSIVEQTDHQSVFSDNRTEQIITPVSESSKADQLSCYSAKSLALIADAYGTDDDDDDDDDYNDDDDDGGGDGGDLDDNEEEEEECLSSNSHLSYNDHQCCSLMPVARSPDNDETEENLGTSDTVVIASDTVLDRVMGMLIRVRLKLEKLWSAGLLHYDPTLVTQLLYQVEELYEEN